MSAQGSAGGTFSDNFRVPGVESQAATDILTQQFPGQSGQSSRIVFHAPEGRLDDAAHRPAVEQALQQLGHGRDVAETTNPFDPQSAAVSTDGQTAYVDVNYTVTKLDVPHLDDAKAAAATTRAAGVQTEFTGGLAQVEQTDPSSELIGIGVAVIVLLIAFGSVVAMGLPIGTALIGILVGSAGVGLLSAF